ncbi:MAG: hypothetical protein REJ24_19475 [Rhodocyclaceae bacterium]|nr:hypothetical protein [Pseudomonadota bacterium]MDQ7974768.1 hypothetical protein [Rhodocyclaceae bacterium]MDQ8002642.1 hypothetical protein [Pseudomonadota bacterium]MDQ8019643.1 hypothetical protein [Pseudomonadota bacterium]
MTPPPDASPAAAARSRPRRWRAVRAIAVLAVVSVVGTALGLAALRFVTETDGSTDRALTRWVEVCTQTGSYLISVAVGRPPPARD